MSGHLQMRREYRGQAYISVGQKPYTRRDGTVTTLTVWQSNCTTCGAEFTFSTPSASGKFAPVRRCPAHRRPGRRVTAITGDAHKPPPSREEVIDRMAQRGHELFPGAVDDWVFWSVSAEQLAEIYRLVWQIATKDQLAEIASIGGMMIECAAVARYGEHGILDLSKYERNERERP